MKKKLSALIKKVLRNKMTPEIVFSLLYKPKEIANRKKLTGLLEKGDDLMSYVPRKHHDHWNGRIEKVLSAPENKNIPRVEKAGEIHEGSLIMHNGIKVDPLSYYSFPLLKMLMDNKGVHEPEEERIFHEVVQSITPHSNMKMLELGAYWSFYSLWFLDVFPNAKTYMAEPDRSNLLFGKRNFKLNNRKGTFIHTAIGEEIDRRKNVTTVDEICRKEKIDFLDILHSDIQGFELEMLHGSTKMLTESRVGYIFISTHSNELHQNCRALLLNHDFIEVANVDLDHTSSWDGVLVMKSKEYSGVSQVEITTLQE